MASHSGAGGGVLVLQKMAERLPFPVYGVQDTVEAPLMGTLRRLSAFYAQKIREKQPNGSYRLAGFSFGTSQPIHWSLINVVVHPSRHRCSSGDRDTLPGRRADCRVAHHARWISDVVR